MALNRLARHAEALAQLQKAHALGSPHPDQAFETGWAFVGLERWEKAVIELERFDKTSPGRGQTQEFLGRAFLGLGQFERADAAFKEALRRDPNLKPTVQVWQALLERRRNGAPAPRKSVADSMRDLPDSRLRSLLGKFRTGAGHEPEKAWNVTVSMGGGYNSNALFLGDGIPVPADSTSKSSAFSRFTLDGNYTWRVKNGDSITAGYSFDGQFYSETPAIDEANHLAFLDYRHPFAAGRLVASLRASDTFTQVGGDRVLTIQTADQALWANVLLTVGVRTA